MSRDSLPVEHVITVAEECSVRVEPASSSSGGAVRRAARPVQINLANFLVWCVVSCSSQP